MDIQLKQRALSKVNDQAYSNRFLDEAPETCTKALALSTAICHAGDWLHVVPSSVLGLHLHGQEFCHCLQYWLGVQMLCSTGQEHKCLRRGLDVQSASQLPTVLEITM